MYKFLFLLFCSASICLSGSEVSKIIKEARNIQKQKGSLAAGKFYLAQAGRPEVNMKDTRKLLNYATGLLIFSDMDLAFQSARRAILTPSNDGIDNQRSFILLGRCYAKVGCFDRAIGALKNALINPKSGHPSLLYSAWYYTGTSHLELREYEAARHAFKEAVKAGKSVRYRFSYKPAERMLERIKNK